MTNLKLKGLRVTYGKNQDDMAKLLSIPVSGYNMRENGKRMFTLPEVKKLMIHFKLTPEQVVDIFFDFEVNMNETEEEVS